jgi:hypothetical protein
VVEPIRTVHRWPKGPFPERYKLAAVERRLEGAWATRGEALARVAALGLAPRRGWDDPWVRILVGPASLEGVRAALGEDGGVFAFRWVGTERAGCAGETGVGLVASADPIDAAVAVGVAGPEHGIGTAAIVRFLAALKGFASFGVDTLGEEHLGIALRPKSRDAARSIAARCLHLCPPLVAARTDVEELAERMERTGRLELVWE